MRPWYWFTVLVLLAAGCASSDATSASTTSSDVATSTTVAISTTNLDETDIEADVEAINAEPDPDRSPPTTETDGLASNTETTVPAIELACWRVEDFGEESVERWSVINDGVMGGLSEGNLEYDGGVVTFDGQINTNGGGFSMIRTDVFRDDQSLAEALTGAEYLRIRLRSANGRAYELTMTDSATNASVMHVEDIAVSDEGLWQEPVISLTDLEPRIFGSVQPGIEAFEVEQTATIGVILADGLDGPFSLQIDRIDACAAA